LGVGFRVYAGGAVVGSSLRHAHTASTVRAAEPHILFFIAGAITGGALCFGVTDKTHVTAGLCASLGIRAVACGGFGGSVAERLVRGWSVVINVYDICR